MFPPKFPNSSQSKGIDFLLSAAIFRYHRMLERVQGPTARNESLEGVVTKATDSIAVIRPYVFGSYLVPSEPRTVYFGILIILRNSFAI